MREILDDKEMIVLIPIKLNTIADLKEFSGVASDLPCDTILTSGTYRIDAKSFFGILSLDLNKTIILEVCSKYQDKFEKWYSEV